MRFNSTPSSSPGLPPIAVASLPIHLTDRLPVEIIEQVIHHLSQCRTALLKCVLVSKSWLTLSRFYMLRNAYIMIGQANAESFIELIQSPVSMMSISRIHAFSFTGTTAQVYRWIGDACLDWSKLTSVRVLHISTEMFPDRPALLQIQDIAAAFPLITSLTIQYPFFDTIATFARMVHQLKYLQQLTIVQPQWSECPADQPGASEYRLPPEMRSIHLTGASEAGCILRWIDAQRHTSPLVHVLVTNHPWESG